MRALVIEDDEHARRTLARILRGMFLDIEVVTVESADQAIAHLEHAALGVCESFALVTSDFNLVGTRTGGDILDWVRARLPALVDRFMFVSGNDAARHYGVPFIEKPYDIDSLRAVARKIVNNH